MSLDALDGALEVRFRRQGGKTLADGLVGLLNKRLIPVVLSEAGIRLPDAAGRRNDPGGEERAGRAAEALVPGDLRDHALARGAGHGRRRRPAGRRSRDAGIKARSRAFFCAAKSSTSTATAAASTCSGRGRRAGSPAGTRRTKRGRPLADATHRYQAAAGPRRRRPPAGRHRQARHPPGRPARNLFAKPSTPAKKGRSSWSIPLICGRKRRTAIIQAAEPATSSSAPDLSYQPASRAMRSFGSPVVVGSGPAGLFAALCWRAGVTGRWSWNGASRSTSATGTWSASGRGAAGGRFQPAFRRRWRGHVLRRQADHADPRPRCRKVLEEFVAAGAAAEILFQRSPISAPTACPPSCANP